MIGPSELRAAPLPHGDLPLSRAVAASARVPGLFPPVRLMDLYAGKLVLGMQMHILVPAVGFWLKHAWIWKHNPAGMFADFNPEVTCP